MKAFAVMLLVLATMGCGGAEEAAPPPPTLEAGALPYLSARERPLDAEALAADSFQPVALASLLEEAGYRTGSEREFFGHSREFERVVARALAFRDAAGAQSYLDWVARNPDDFLGRSERETAPALGQGAVLFSLSRCDACKKQQPTYLAAWRRDATVAFLLAGGPGADWGLDP